MKLRFFYIPAVDAGSAEEALNRFCASHVIASLDKQFVSDGACSFWSICIEYVEMDDRPVAVKREKIDYKEVLDEKDFALFSKLRSLRKILAEKEGVPLYSLFTNEQLASMARERTMSPAAMLNIQGIGKSRVEKYGDAFLELLQRECHIEVKSETDPD